MKADADAAAAEEGDSDDSDEEREAMDVAEVQEKLEACSEAELKQMLKDMKLPTKGKVGAPASPPPAPAPSNSPVAARSSRHARTSHAGALRA